MEYASGDLMHEHDAILFSLKILDEIATRIESGEDVLLRDITDFIDFLKLFADKCHHGKEEGFLFPALEEEGIQNQYGPIGVMLEEHDAGRKFIKQMDLASTDNTINKEDFVKSARGYISLMRAHIKKENEVLFPIGDMKLSPSKQRDLLKAFEEFEDNVIGKGKHEELHEMLKNFKNKYLK
jgi:hemerythrin-like domain-containing protein